MKRDKQSNNEIQKIINSQASRDQRLSIADDVILNIGSLTDLKQEIFKIHNNYMEIKNNG
jgi:dephospho-CoA kinase